MSEEIPKFTHSEHNISHQLNQKITPVTIKDLIIFKDELLKELHYLKLNITNNINNEFLKYTELVENINKKIDNFEKEKLSFILKSEFIYEKDNIFSLISNKEEELKKKLMLTDAQISTCQKDLEKSTYRYDKTIVDNLYVPGLIGNACRFPNLKEYILYNKDELSSTIIINKQISMDFKSFKKKTEMNMKQINDIIKQQEIKLSNLMNSKIFGVVEKYDGLYDALNEKINNLDKYINSKVEYISKEEKKLNNLVDENKKAIIDDNEIFKEDITTQMSEINNHFQKIKKSILSLANLLIGKNNAQNKQMIINSFNNMMMSLFKELNIEKKREEKNNEFLINNNNQNRNIKNNIQKNNNNNNNNYNNNNNDKNKIILFKNMKKYSTANVKFSPKEEINSLVNSSVKEYIEGKISANDTKFHPEKIKVRRRYSLQLNNQSLLRFQNEFIKKMDTINNISKNISKTLNKRSSQINNYNPDLMKNIINKNSFSENIKTNENNIEIENKKSSLDLEIINKSKSVKNNNIPINIKKNFNDNSNENKNEIINEEESNSISSDNNQIEKSKRSNKRINYISDEGTKNKNNLSVDDSSNMSSNSKKEKDSSSKNNTKINDINNYSNLIKNTNNIINDIKGINDTIFNENINNNNNNLNNLSNDIDKNEKKDINNNQINKSNNLSNTLIDKNIKNNISINNKKEKNEKSIISIRKFGQNSKIRLKKNFDLKLLKENIKEKKYNTLTLNNINKQNEINQTSLNKINNNNTLEYTQNKTLQNNNSNKTPTKYLNYISKTILFQNKDLIIKNNRNKNINIINTEKDNYYSSFDNNKNNLKKNINNNYFRNNTDKKSKEYKPKLNYTTNIDKDDKDIYLDKDVFKNVRFIKDEEIIDKPLLFYKNDFKIDKNKGILENKIIELEYFTKKRFDELVKEIKNFIPIHFNSHLKDYSLRK